MMQQEGVWFRFISSALQASDQMSGEMIVMAGDWEESSKIHRSGRSPALSGDLAALVKKEFPVSTESR